MKKLICFLLLLYVENSFAQDSTKILIKADQVISEVLTPDKIYQYPKFIKGKILFKDKTSTEAFLNYNFLNGEIEFLSNNGDTLAIATYQMLNLQNIAINTDTFYYHDGYLRQMVHTPSGRLAKKQTLVVAKTQMLGAHDHPSETKKFESLPIFRDYYGSTSTTSIKARENIVLTYRNEYFFGDNYFLFLPASKKNLLRIFESKKEAINNYLKGNNVDFRNGEQLEKLLLAL